MQVFQPPKDFSVISKVSPDELTSKLLDSIASILALPSAIRAIAAKGLCFCFKPKTKQNFSDAFRQTPWKQLTMSTIRVPETVPSPIQDSESLRKAFKGYGTDEKAVMWVLGHRNASQRRKIRETYEQIYKESLISRLQSELSGDFKNAVVLWVLDPPERDAKIASGVLRKKKGVGNLQVIAEMACATSPNHLIAVRQAYCSLFDCSLEEDIVSNVIALPLRKLLIGLVSSYRYNGEVFDEAVVELEVTKLHDAIERKQLDDEDLLYIFSTRNVCQLRATFQLYKHTYGNSIDQDIKSCGKGDLESILQVVVWCIGKPEKHFAEVLKSAMTGIGTDEGSLTRVIITRAEIDMMKIRGEYYNLYSTSLDNAIIGETSGDYKNFLMTLLGARL